MQTPDRNAQQRYDCFFLGNHNISFLPVLFYAPEFQVAFVKYFKVCSTRPMKDPETRLLKLKWENEVHRWQLAEIENILRIVHVAPLFIGVDDTVTDTFLLNQYIWR